MTDTALEAPGTAARAKPVPLLSRRYTLELRQQMALPKQALILALAVAAGLVISAAILVAAGVPANELLNEFVMQTLVDRQSVEFLSEQAEQVRLVNCPVYIAPWIGRRFPE